MKKGIVLSVFSSVLFSVLYYYSTVLYPLGGAEIFSWRVLLALPALALLITRGRAWGEVAQVARRLCREWTLALSLIASAALIGVQLWLFMWAPLHQKALDVSLGYFLLPLVMVLVGRLFYRERLSATQWVAVAIAAVGVVHELYRVNAFSWATVVVMLGYPPYFMLRRVLRIGSLTSLWFDMLLLAPVAVFILQTQDVGVIGQFFNHPRLLGLIPVLGLISSVALVSYIAASRLLPLGLFGILGYVEPILLFWVALLFLNESMAPGAWFTYIPIWIAISVIVAEGLLAWVKEARRTCS
ncbi:MAG TPA: EamA family transporter RarD [Eoetvoesiella sp.]